jgi:hypothetical protein
MPQPPDQPAPSDTVAFDSFSGLKNTVDATNLTARELERAINIDLDDAGKAHRRRGKTLKSAGKFHSLFVSDRGKLICVKNQTLGFVRTDYTFVPVMTGISAQPPLAQLSYVQVGGKIYFSSPNECGIIDEAGETVAPWGPSADIWLSPVINPTAGLPAIAGRLLGSPPLATNLAYWNGRIYLAQDSLLWATELYLYNVIDKTRNFFPFEAPITMVGAVGDGIYVGTEEGCWFLSGSNIKELKRTRVLDSPVIPGSMVYMPAEMANPPQVDLGADQPVSVSLLFMTNNGYCAGQNGGVCYNLTESKVAFPDATSAAAFYRKQYGVHQYVAVLNSGGDPASSACIGDYVDTELIRAADR